MYLYHKDLSAEMAQTISVPLEIHIILPSTYNQGVCKGRQPFFLMVEPLKSEYPP